jgi:ligand-binding sensor domain-containing protein/DNA-binding CsgD family transcriptional regulator
MKFLIFYCIFPICLFSQNTIALPDIVNFSKQSYGAGLQNWDIQQDKNGIVYCANNEGLLTFDGNKWKLYPLPNKTIVRSVLIAPDSKIYVGGQDELGYFTPTTNGMLQYHSLTQFLNMPHKTFGDVWDIVNYKNEVFFRTSSKIFRFHKTIPQVYNSNSQFLFLGMCNGKLYAQESNKGLYMFIANAFEQININNALPITAQIANILPLNNDSAIITTLQNGLYSLTSNSIIKINSANNPIFEQQRIYASSKINNNWIALATNNNGVYIIDTKGNIIQSFSKKEGLQNNKILSVFEDKQGNLWLGLDNGIDVIAYNNAIKHINPLFQDGSGYAASILNNILYLGTANGLFGVGLQSNTDLSFSKGNFVPIANTNGQTWHLATINNQLLLGHHEGAFAINNFAAKQISNQTGFWNFVPIANSPNKIIAGNYNGINILDVANNSLQESKKVEGFTESSRFVALDAQGNIWISHPYHGIYKITNFANTPSKTVAYSTQNGLPSNLNNHVYTIKNEVVVATEKGIYSFDASKNTFEPSAYFYKILGNQSIRYLKEDDLGNIWFIHEKKLGVIDVSQKEPTIIYISELNDKLVSGFDFIYPANNNNIFLGGEKGFYHINYNKYKQTIAKMQVQIRCVKVLGAKDSTMFGGYFKEVNEIQIQDIDNLPKIKSNYTTIHFEFASTNFSPQSNLEYSYRLKGFDNNWSDFSPQTEKEYTNIGAGKYTFEVRVRNNLSNVSEIAAYTFVILPPWYLSIWAKILYSIVAIALVWFLIKWQQKKFEMQQIKHQTEQNKIKYIHDLELNKTESELIALQKEKLELDIDFKNSELASSAMHLVKKGELLTKIKTELNQIMRSYDNAQASSEIKKLLKHLGDDESIDNEWDAFSKHFDRVHNDFLIELKAKHPNISPSELKLSAYLNMNLSSKEIAQLMNISLRGVEISRYRLRKKLGLHKDENLVTYMLSIETKK